MQDSREDLTQREASTAPAQPRVNLDVSTEDVETLMSLQDAGLIDLDALEELGAQDPELVDWTYEDFQRHMVAAQGLAQGTAECRVRYIRFIEEHDEAPVELRPPSEKSWQNHVLVRFENGATGSALNHYRKALKSLLKFLGMDMWNCLDSQFREPQPTWSLPDPQLATRFWTGEDTWGHDVPPFKRITLAYVFHFGFHTGVRAPSEIVALDVQDVDRDAGEIVVTEKKKRGKRRRMPLPPYVIDAHTSKSLGNYIDCHRDKVDPDTDAVFVTPSGDRWDTHYLRTELSRLGKRVWPQFHPYTMRRYFATEMLIATDFNVYKVAEAIGDEVRTVEKHYLDRARARSQMDLEYVPRIRGGEGR